MPYTIDYLKDERIVLITNLGEFTHDDFLKQAQETYEVGLLNHCSLFLVDCTSMIARASTLKIFSTPDMYEKMNAPRTNKVALIAPTDQDTKTDLKFYETVCVNRGWPIKMFADRDSAVRWLRE